MGVTLALVGLGLVAVVGCGGSSGGGGGGGEAVVTGLAVDDGTLARLRGAVAEIGGARSAPTGADGVWRLTGIGTGSRQVEVSAPDHQSVSLDVSVHSGTTNAGTAYLPPVLSAGRGAVTGVMVLAGTYQPVSGGTIQVADASARSRSDGTGRFTIYNVPAGNKQIAFIDNQTGRNAWRYVDVQAGLTTNIGTVILDIGPPPPPPI